MPGAPLVFRAQSPDLRQLYTDLRAVPGNMTRELRKGVVAAAKPAVAAVKEEASWSSRIPGSIKAKASFGARSTSVQIIADPAVAPEAAVLNHGGRGGQFRHPVFGNRNNWVNQAARPFFETAVRRTQPQIEQAIVAVMDEVARKAGFR